MRVRPAQGRKCVLDALVGTAPMGKGLLFVEAGRSMAEPLKLPHLPRTLHTAQHLDVRACIYGGRAWHLHGAPESQCHV